MAKMAMIGAGSLVFGKTLIADFLATSALAGSEYSSGWPLLIFQALPGFAWEFSVSNARSWNAVRRQLKIDAFSHANPGSTIFQNDGVVPPDGDVEARV